MRSTFVAAIAVGLFLGAACQDVPIVMPSATGPSSGIGAAPSFGGGGQAPATGGSIPSTGGMDVAPVWLGVRANVAAESPPALAELRAAAAGVRLVPVEIAFGDLDEVALQSRLAGYADDQLRVVITLLVVDGHAAHRPEGLEQTPWDDPAMQLALVEELTAIAAAGQIEAIAIGRRVDVYLDAFPAEAFALAALLEHGIEAGPQEALIGVGLSHVMAEPPTLAASLAAAGEVSVRSYLPGLGDAALSPAPVAMHLDAMVEAAGQRPILLHDVGFSSAAELSASEETQLQQIEAFFSALTPRRARFPWVVVHQLHDLDEASCAALGAAQGAGETSPFASFACQTGLRTALDAPKKAWTGFLEATAWFAAP